MTDPIQRLAESLDDPYPLYAELRRETPVVWHEPLGSWILTRHADCVAVLKDSDRFAADWRRVGEEMPPPALSIQTLDPPEHVAIRRLLIEAVRSQDNADTERMIATEAARLADRLAGRSSFDLVSEFAEPLALRTVTGFLGVAEPELSWFVPIATTIVDGMDSGVWPERHEPAMVARAELSAWTDKWLDDPPGGGIVGFLADRSDGRGVERSVLVNSLRVLLHAGYTSASKLLSLAVEALLRTSTGLAGLAAADPRLAIEELARFTSPVQAMARACVEDVRFGEVTIRSGQAVTLLLGAANRDPDRFPGPDRLDLRRHPNPHLGFGRGAHSCLGAPLAALQARIGLAVLADRAPRLRLVAPAEYRRTLTLRSLNRLEVTSR